MSMLVTNEPIHGGMIVVRQVSDNMYPHLPGLEKARLRETVLAHARRLFPWAPKKLAVHHGQLNYQYYLYVELLVPDSVRAAAVEERLKAAERTRCACGSYGSWDDSISGTSGDVPCVWAGCPNCRGTALGVPILSVDLSWYESWKRP